MSHAAALTPARHSPRRKARAASSLQPVAGAEHGVNAFHGFSTDTSRPFPLRPVTSRHDPSRERPQKRCKQRVSAQRKKVRPALGEADPHLETSRG